MIFINILVFFIGGCVSNNDSLHFKKYQIDKNDLIAKRVAIDTIESFVSNGLYLVNIVDYGFLGNFSTHLAIMKKINHKHI